MENKYSIVNPIYSMYKKLPFRIALDSDYVPVFSILNNDDAMFPNYSRKALYQNFERMGYGYNRTNSINFTSISDIEASSEKFINYSFTTEGYNDNSRTNLNYKTLFGLPRLSLVRILRNSFISGCNATFNIDEINNTVVPLYMMVVKREHIKYIRQCALLDKEIHPGALRLMVNSEFDITNSEFRLMRTRYRKNVKKEAIEQGIEIVTVDNFDSIFLRIQPPKALGLNGYQKQLADLSVEFLKEIK